MSEILRPKSRRWYVVERRGRHLIIIQMRMQDATIETIASEDRNTMRVAQMLVRAQLSLSGYKS